MYKATMRSAWAEINLINLEHNLRSIRAKVGFDKEIIAVVKADAYGHGSVKVAKTLKENGVTTFAVSSIEEAMTLREGGIKDTIVLFCLVPDICADIIIEQDLVPMVSNYSSAKAYSDAAESAGTTVSGYVAIDTGMGRIGLLTDDADADASVEEIKKINGLPAFNIRGIFSHFSCADCEDQSFSAVQLDSYNKFTEKLKAEGIEGEMNSFANSAAILELPDAYYQAVRPGIILYGAYPSDEVHRENLSLLPVMSVKARVAYLKNVSKGFSVSYGRAFVTERPSTIATVTVGYADGLPRRYSGNGHVLINGRKVPIVGNICMDQCMIDVTDIEGIKVGDEVVIMGSEGPNSITSDDIAAASGTINYEILCGFGKRLPKVYIK
ncbi:MAG: alanine racemase [Firmicutes bacterium]|nr:alanine racemase [Bacillota bacterium]MBR2511891.1 alanine racemase [Bacillota bacterium]MDO4859491.1 alanine racemase [Bacillota bacterium]